MKQLVMLVSAALVLGFSATSYAQGYTKCQTVNGTIIVVSGYLCPPGTIYLGPGLR